MIGASVRKYTRASWHRLANYNLEDTGRIVIGMIFLLGATLSPILVLLSLFLNLHTSAAEFLVEGVKDAFIAVWLLEPYIRARHPPYGSNTEANEAPSSDTS